MYFHLNKIIPSNKPGQKLTFKVKACLLTKLYTVDTNVKILIDKVIL